MQDDHLRVIHSYNLAHTKPLHPFNKVYSASFSQFSNQSNINLPDFVDHEYCNKCGVISIPGITTSTRIKYPIKKTHRKKLNIDSKNLQTTKKEPTNDKKRFLQITCLECKSKVNNYDLINVSNKLRDPIVDKQVPTNDTTNMNKAKPKSKKRKNDLTSLLQAKKKQDEQRMKSSLNLMEFMK